MNQDGSGGDRLASYQAPESVPNPTPYDRLLMPIKIPYPPSDEDECPHRQAICSRGPTQISRFSADTHVVPDDVKRGDGHSESALSEELTGGDDADESDLSRQGE